MTTDGSQVVVIGNRINETIIETTQPDESVRTALYNEEVCQRVSIIVVSVGDCRRVAVSVVTDRQIQCFDQRYLTK